MIGLILYNGFIRHLARMYFCLRGSIIKPILHYLLMDNVFLIINNNLITFCLVSFFTFYV